MRFHGVYLLCCVVKLDGFGAIVAVRAGLLVLLCMMRGALLGVFFQDFIIFRRVLRAMQQAFLFRTGCLITQMACIVSLDLASSDLLGFGWRGGC